MTDVEVVNILKEMSIAGLKVGGPILLLILVVGTVISLIQTVTQVQEQAIVYVVKFAAVGALLLIAGPWMLDQLSTFFVLLWDRIPEVE
jgi:flagellar biosynthetic protein FliQ